VILKPGVRIRGTQPEILLGLQIIEPLFVARAVVLVVTSLNDGEHMPASLHYLGLAADLRSRELTRDQQRELVREARQRLGECYELILEPSHFHVELSPIGLEQRRAA